MRRPLMPWISASTSSAQSQVRQNGLCQRAATNPKSTRPTPSSSTCMIRTCPTASTSSSEAADAHEQPRPQLESADRALAASTDRVATAGAPGEVSRGSVVVAMTSPRQQVHDLADHDPGDGHHARRRTARAWRTRAAGSVPRQAREEVDQHDLHAVERVGDHGGDQSELEQPHDRVVVDADDAVVGLGPQPTTAVSTMWANRNRIIATPVMRWTSQHHWPSCPR